MIFCACVHAEPEHPNDDFIGSWKLLSWKAKLADGTIVYPYGREAYGKIIYEPNGEMNAILMADERKLMSSESVDERIPEEALAAFNSFFAYAGPYEVHRDSGFVLHHVEACINPNWVGRTQRRQYEFKRDSLILSTPPISVRGTRQQAVQQTLRWVKIK